MNGTYCYVKLTHVASTVGLDASPVVAHGLPDWAGEAVAAVDLPELCRRVIEADVAAAIGGLLAQAHAKVQQQTLAEFSDQLAAARGQGGPPRAVAGVADVLEALAEQRIATLLLTGDFHAAGARCWRDGMLGRCCGETHKTRSSPGASPGDP